MALIPSTTSSAPAACEAIVFVNGTGFDIKYHSPDLKLFGDIHWDCKSDAVDEDLLVFLSIDVAILSDPVGQRICNDQCCTCYLIIER